MVTKGKVTLFLIASLSFLCAASPVSAYNFSAKRDQALNWVSLQRVRGGTTYNWVAVNETATYGYTYDNALAVIAYTTAGQLVDARALQGFLSQYQLSDGCFYDAMFQANGLARGTQRSSGNQAWALYAIAFYTQQTGDPFYLSMGDRVASWLLARQDPSDGGITGGINSNGTERAWTSTEHNVDAYFAFKLYYTVTGNSLYLDAANRCKDWLLNVGWNAAESRFNTGENDPSVFLDAQSLGALFMKDIGDSQKQNALLRYIQQNFYTVKTYQRNGKTQVYSGYEYAPHDGSLWWEGTEQVDRAALSRAQKGRFISLMLVSDDPRRAGLDNDGDGGYQYSMEAGTYHLGTLEQPSSGLWLIFAINDYLGDRPTVFDSVTAPPSKIPSN